MKLTVQFHKLNEQGEVVSVGHVHWDGASITATTPQLEEIIASPIRPFPPKGGGATEFIDASTDPEQFMRQLYLTFKSAYFWASKATLD